MSSTWYVESAEKSFIPYYLRILAQDLAPTLAFLTGISIPENNLGALIPDLMIASADHHEGDSEGAETAAAFYYNAIQVSQVMKSNLGQEATTKSKNTIIRCFLSLSINFCCKRLPQKSNNF